MANLRKATLNGPGGIRLVLDRDRAHPDDPGADTPELVCLFGATATLHCAIGEGEVDGGPKGMRKLTEAQQTWLDTVSGYADAWVWKGDDGALQRARELR